MATNFREETTERLGLPTNASASDRREALRCLTLEELIELCMGFPDPRTAYTFYQDFITQLEQWDVVEKDGRYIAVWGDLAIHSNPTSEGALVALQTYVDALYPVDFIQAQASRIRLLNGLWIATYDGQIVGRGLDPYSACIDLLSYRLALQEDGLIGTLHDATLFEVAV